MDNPFAQILVDVATEMSGIDKTQDTNDDATEANVATEVDNETVETEVEETEVNEEPVEEITETETEETDEEPTETKTLNLETEVNEPAVKDKSYQEFAQMRVEKKQLEQKIKQFEEIAKKMKFANVDELIEKTEKALLVEEANEKNIPVEYLEKVKETEKRLKDLEEKAVQEQFNQKKNKFDALSSTIIADAKLTSKQIDKFASEISQDFTLEQLVEMPEPVLTRILKSYIPGENKIQKALEKKVEIKKEISAVKGTSGNATTIDLQEENIDKLARYLAGKE